MLEPVLHTSVMTATPYFRKGSADSEMPQIDRFASFEYGPAGTAFRAVLRFAQERLGVPTVQHSIIACAVTGKEA